MPLCGHGAARKSHDAILERVRAARAIIYRGPGVVVKIGLCCRHLFGSVCAGKAVKGEIAVTTKGTAVSTLCDESALRCASDGGSQVTTCVGVFTRVSAAKAQTDALLVKPCVE